MRALDTTIATMMGKAYTNGTLIKQTIETNVKLDKTNTYPTNDQLTKQVMDVIA